MENSKEQWVEWKQHSITQAVFAKLEEMKSDYLENLGNDIYKDDMRSKVVGRIQAYNDLLQIDLEED